MPTIGEIRYGHEIGRKNSKRFMWCAFETCRKERWITLVKGKPENTKCVTCCKIGNKLTFHAVSDKNATEGDIKTAKELGFKGKGRYIYHSCFNCGRLRWVQLRTKDKYKKCRKCMNKGKIMEQSGTWNGGRKINYAGYIMVRLYSDNPYYKMANTAGYVFEHRLVMAQKLNRCLEDWELVHHRDSIKTHNEPDNLYLTDASNHNTLVEATLKRQDKHIKVQDNRISGLEARATLLEAENTLLKADMSEFV